MSCQLITFALVVYKIKNLFDLACPMWQLNRTKLIPIGLRMKFITVKRVAFFITINLIHYLLIAAAERQSLNLFGNITQIFSYFNIT